MVGGGRGADGARRRTAGERVGRRGDATTTTKRAPPTKPVGWRGKRVGVGRVVAGQGADVDGAAHAARGGGEGGGGGTWRAASTERRAWALPPLPNRCASSGDAAAVATAAAATAAAVGPGHCGCAAWGAEGKEAPIPSSAPALAPRWMPASSARASASNAADDAESMDARRAPARPGPGGGAAKRGGRGSSCSGGSSVRRRRARRAQRGVHRPPPRPRGGAQGQGGQRVCARGGGAEAEAGEEVERGRVESVHAQLVNRAAAAATACSIRRRRPQLGFIVGEEADAAAAGAAVGAELWWVGGRVELFFCV